MAFVVVFLIGFIFGCIFYSSISSKVLREMETALDSAKGALHSAKVEIAALKTAARADIAKIKRKL